MRPAWAVLSLALLSACGGDGAIDDPLERYLQKEVQWKSCAGLPAGSYIEVLPASVQERTRCASILAPIDYAHPQNGDLSVGVMRMQAEHTGATRRLLFLNPGGPGADSTDVGVMLARLWSQSTDATETGRLQRKLLQTYDLVAFSPRGLGSSTQLVCESDETLVPTDNSVSGRTDENIALQFRNTELIAQACGANPLSKHINTQQTVHDMDLIRELLGDEKFNYMGWSYGTWLGAWYGSVFPDNVGRMVLDSSVDFSLTLHDTALLQPPALTRTFDDVLAPYAARHPDIFELGDNVDVIRNILGQTQPVLQQAVSSLMYHTLFSSWDAPETLGLLLVARELNQDPFRPHLPDGVAGGNIDELRMLVGAHAFSRDEEANIYFRELAHGVVNKIDKNVREKPVYLAGPDAVYTAVVCNDTPTPSTDPQWWIDAETSIYQNYPMVTTDDVRSCLYWQRPADVEKPSISAMADVQVLMLQSEYDGATPEPHARATFAKLPKAHMIYVPGEMTHGLYPYKDECVDLLVARYLLDQPMPGRETTCAAHPLAKDGPPDTGLAPQAATSEASSTYQDQAEAQRVVKKLKSAIR